MGLDAIIVMIRCDDGSKQSQVYSEYSYEHKQTTS